MSEQHPLLEQEILLWSMRLDGTEPAWTHAGVPGEIDWDKVLRLATEHGLLHLLYHHVKALHTGMAPVEVLQTLNMHAVRNTVRNLHLWQRLGRLVTVLTEHGISAVPVKGLVLAHQAYGDLTLRQLADLDILLLDPANLDPAYTALRSAGYHAAEPIAPRAHTNNMHFWDGDVLFEIHRSMPEREYGCALDGKDLASRLQQISIYGQTVPTLSPEDTLLLLMLHGAKHQWNRLIWIADVAYLLRATPRLDWTALCARVECLGVRRIFLTGLLLARQLSGVTYPDNLQARCASDPVVGELVAYLRGTLLLDEPTATAGFLRYMLRSRERLRDKLYFLTYPRESDQNLVRLPRFLFTLYYLIRPLRMLGKAALAMFVPRTISSG